MSTMELLNVSHDHQHVEPERLDAAKLALSRARQNASARGLRPGMTARGSTLRAAKRIHAGEVPMTGRDPVLFSDTVAKLFAERGWDESVSTAGVIGRWRDIVGAHIADHCVPEAFDGSVLLVRSDSTAWATQVRLLASQLILRIAEDLGEGVVTEVRVLPPAGPSWKRGPRSVPGRGPRDTYG